MPSSKKISENFRSPRKIARRLKYLPLAVRKIRTWPAFMYHYALGLTPRTAYRFRNGAKLIISRGVDHVPIIEIFLKEEYGTVADGAVVIDLGANIGAFSIYATTIARNVQVYAYEPMPEFCAILNENARLNQRSECLHVFNCAVAAEAGVRHLDLGSDGFFFPRLANTASDQNEGNIVVQTTTLAHILESNHLDRVDLLKMDCEGAEYEILYSTPLSCLEKISNIRMEYHNLDSGERNVGGLERFLAQSGFTVTQQYSASETNGILWVERK